MADVKRGTGQHHGDLRNTLLDVAHELVAEKGPLGWSMAEASRRASVSVAAPYKHFADRDDLLAALAARGFDRLSDTLRAAMATDTDPRAQVARFASCYIRFAWEDRALFDAAYNAHRDKARYPELMGASQAIFDLLIEPALLIVGAKGAPDLVFAVGALTHGYAVLLLEQAFGVDDDALPNAERAAHTAVRNLIAGTPNERGNCGMKQRKN